MDLSRKEMIEVLREGGSLVYKGQHLKSIVDLPSEAELALGDTEKEQEAAANLMTEFETIKKQLELLNSKKVETPAVEKNKPAAAKETKDAKETKPAKSEVITEAV